MDTDIKKVPQRFQPSPEESSCMSESPTNKFLPIKDAAEKDNSELPEIVANQEAKPAFTEEDSPDTLISTFMEVFGQINGSNYELKDVIGPLYKFIKTLGYHAVSILMIDPASQEHFTPIYSRGYKTPPPADLVPLMEEAINFRGGSIDWDKLMIIAEDKCNPLGRWAINEGFSRLGFAPVNDGSSIIGVIIIAFNGGKKPVALSSPLLELCSIHLGLMMSLSRIKNARPLKK